MMMQYARSVVDTLNMLRNSGNSELEEFATFIKENRRKYYKFFFREAEKKLSPEAYRIGEQLLAESKSEMIRSYLAEYVKDEGVIRKLCSDSELIRGFLTVNENVPNSIINELARDESCKVAASAIDRVTDRDVLREFSKHRNEHVRKCASKKLKQLQAAT